MISTIKSLTIAVAAGVLFAGAGAANAQIKPLPVAQSDYNSASNSFNTAKKKRDTAQKAYNKKKTPQNLAKLNTAKKNYTKAQNSLRTANTNLSNSRNQISTLLASLSSVVRDTSTTSVEDPNYSRISALLSQLVTLNAGLASSYYQTAISKLGYYNPRANATALLNTITPIINSASYLNSSTQASVVTSVQNARTGYTPGNPNNGYQASLWVSPVFVQS